MSKILPLLAIATGLRESTIERIVHNAPDRYKTYKIPKKSGGVRFISQPAKEVKILQHALMVVLLDNLPVHRSATAYRSGMSTLDNARPHAGHRPIIKMDLKDFFPSIKKADWAWYCDQTRCVESSGDIDITSNILFQRPKGSRILRLAIGAPSSPMLSNALMYEFDSKIETAVSRDKVAYTRYADDLTFSAPRTGYLTGVVKAVATTIRSLKHPNLQINSDKTCYVTTKYQRTVTGLTLANDGRITIGREGKREIRASIHRLVNSNLSIEEIQILCGLLAYVKSVEPSYLDDLNRKYGPEVIKTIQRAVLIGSSVIDPNPQ